MAVSSSAGAVATPPSLGPGGHFNSHASYSRQAWGCPWLLSDFTLSGFGRSLAGRGKQLHLCHLPRLTSWWRHQLDGLGWPDRAEGEPAAATGGRVAKSGQGPPMSASHSWDESCSARKMPGSACSLVPAASNRCAGWRSDRRQRRGWCSSTSGCWRRGLDRLVAGRRSGGQTEDLSQLAPHQAGAAQSNMARRAKSPVRPDVAWPTNGT